PGSSGAPSGGRTPRGRRSCSRGRRTVPAPFRRRTGEASSPRVRRGTTGSSPWWRD
ncbi:MAG: hypothetical protein AVDCRST_MAG59-4270, partial [uncultured Thermomicrobiales bacterium]